MFHTQTFKFLKTEVIWQIGIFRFKYWKQFPVQKTEHGYELMGY